MQIVRDESNLVGSYVYIGDRLAEVIHRVARGIADDDIDAGFEALSRQLEDMGASRFTEDAAWCRYALNASRRGEPLTVVL
jgi:hypothetical protein